MVSAIMALVLLTAACGGDDTTEDSSPATTAPAGDATTDTAAPSDGTEPADEGPNEADGEATGDPSAVEPAGTIRLITHDSFSVPDNIFDQFTLDTGYEVEQFAAGDAGELVSRAILTAGQPEADVLFGVDNSFLQRALDNDLFVPYESTLLDAVPAEFRLDPENRVTPIDYGDVCVNYWTDALDGPPPASIADLTDPALAASFVTEDPETSSPGFAFLLATIATFGPDGWEDYWQQLADGGVTVTPGWTEAYYDEFAAGGGERSLVTSYASSPVAEYIFATSDITEPPTGVITDGCFRQIEFAGILNGTAESEAAGLLIDYLLSPTFQAEIPLNMFVAPANSSVELPEVYAQWAAEVTDPVTLDPAEIEANRDAWTERWAEIVLR